MSVRVAIFGATGNVGTSLVRRLAIDPGLEHVTAVARRRPVELEIPNVTWATADIERDPLVPLLRDADVVVHLAWAIQPSHDINELRRVNLLGTARLLDAVREADVRSLVYASSVGAYLAAPHDRRVDESWPTRGVPSSFYSRHKAAVERMLDRFERDVPDVRIARMRPALTFKRSAAAEIRRLFIGPFFPRFLAWTRVAPFVPDVDGLTFQCVHAEDVAEAYRIAIVSDARGAFNLAAEPVLSMRDVGDALGTRTLRLAGGVVRRGADITWRLRLQPTPAGWVDLALQAPLMSAERARRELGWEPRHTARDALADLVSGLAGAEGDRTPPLHPRAGGPLRVREFLTGIGGRTGVERRSAA